MMGDFDKDFMSAEYTAGYNKGYSHGIRAAAICLVIVFFTIHIFN